MAVNTQLFPSDGVSVCGLWDVLVGERTRVRTVTGRWWSGVTVDLITECRIVEKVKASHQGMSEHRPVHVTCESVLAVESVHDVHDVDRIDGRVEDVDSFTSVGT